MNAWSGELDPLEADERRKCHVFFLANFIFSNCWVVSKYIVLYLNAQDISARFFHRP